MCGIVHSVRRLELLEADGEEFSAFFLTLQRFGSETFRVNEETLG